jgi:hypothetical protein
MRGTKFAAELTCHVPLKIKAMLRRDICRRFIG